MRASLVLALGFLAAAASEMEAAEQFPFRAEVKQKGATIRSGPGSQHYPTAALESGREVRVYRRAPGGWFAVRPPTGSFSWIEAKALETGSHGRTGIIQRDGIVSWIGTSEREQTDFKWQISLEKGEIVELLKRDRVSLPGRDGLVDCFKIAPPSGEFRWVHESEVINTELARTEKDAAHRIQIADLELDEPRPHRSTGSTKVSPKSPLAAATAELPDGTGQESPPVPPTAVVAPAVHLQEGTAEADSDHAADEPGNPPEEEEPVRIRIEEAPTTESTASEEAPTAAHEGEAAPATRGAEVPKLLLSGVTFQEKTRSLEAHLTREVAQSPAEWELAAVQSALSELRLETSTTSEQIQLQALQARLNKFTAFQRRYDRFHGTDGPQAVAATTAAAGTGAVAAATQVGATGTLNPRFDGKGWLLPVHSTRRDAPPYALLDGKGKILNFVSPAPGVNLNRYVRKEIGLYGQRRTQMLLGKGHLTAQRIVDLNRHKTTTR